ncbi:hypothetical protein H6P81_003192 [Aristolochia fimbriata]|uniref:Putative plant transposon protein domain-containing protein n=1 Tax=Aristolochia fimbriata TaxID=158543 RepID=A0AAV7FCG2_ARIFI|nr:hypothetical protein H6P81_003192 [Aristolochia fimbriata]
MPRKYMTLKKKPMTPSDPRRFVSAIAEQRYRERQVRFDRRMINVFYGLPDEEVDMLHLRQEVTLDDHVAYLYPNGAEWATGTYGRPRNILKRDLRPETRVWMYFICVRLLPATHYTEVTVDHAYLLYAITTGHPINVGLHIQVAMQHTCETVSRGLYFPSLVTALCEAVGIPVRSSEHIISLEKPLTKMFIMNVYRQPCHRSHPGQAQAPQAPPLMVLQRLDHIECYVQCMMASSADPFYPLGRSIWDPGGG